ncbi:MAG: cupin domain-containing protein [Janthinobacterium lividum]
MNHSEIFIKGVEQAWENTEPGVKRQVLAHNEDLMLVKVAFEAGAIGTVHQHIHTQTSYLLSGKFEVTINGKTEILNVGDSFYVPPASLHGVVCLEAGVLLDAFNPRREDFLKI